MNGTTARLSEVEAEMVARLPPQGQAERLLQYAISHHAGATNEIEARVGGWRGVITTSPRAPGVEGTDARAGGAGSPARRRSIAFIGTDDTVGDLVDAFHRDPSWAVRIQGGGCGLAHCGMLTRAQRMQAVPGLIAMVEDPALDGDTRLYGYRALREITDETFPDDPRQWRDWYLVHGLETTNRVRTFEQTRRN